MCVPVVCAFVFPRESSRRVWFLADIDVNNLTTIALVAQAAVARMQTWYEDGVFE
jgi:hypothetical protein